MVRAIREIVTAGPGGRVQLDVPDLKPGDRAEVIVLLDEQAASAATQAPGTPDPLAALERLQRVMGLDANGAEEWVRAAADERRSSARS